MNLKRKAAAAVAVLGSGIAVSLWTAGNSSAQSYPVVLQVSGGGNATTAVFSTGSDWALHWTFACPGTGSLRVVEQGDAEAGVPLVDTAGPSGGATMYSHNAAGRHTLVVTSSCQWTLTATDGDLLPHG